MGMPNPEDLYQQELFDDSPGSKPKKRGIGKYIAGGLGGLAVGGLLLYKTLFSPDVIHERPEYKGAEERSVVEQKVYTHSMPEDFFEIKTLPEEEREAALKEIVKHKKPPKQGLKPYLDGLAWIDDDGWIYPDDVERDKYGRPLYDFTDPEQVLLANWEAYNNKDPSLLAKVAWRTLTDSKRLIPKVLDIIFDSPVIPQHRYKILEKKEAYEGKIIYIKCFYKGLVRPEYQRLGKNKNGEWELF